jgi:formylglycine-generating enzyme required for sulfatase activity
LSGLGIGFSIWSEKYIYTGASVLGVFYFFKGLITLLTSVNETKKRHGFITFWLWAMIIVNALFATAFSPFFRDELALSICFLCSVVFYILLIRWKKAGFWGLIASTVICPVIIGIVGSDLEVWDVAKTISIWGLVQMGILFAIFQIRTDGIKSWNRLDTMSSNMKKYIFTGTSVAVIVLLTVVGLRSCEQSKQQTTVMVNGINFEMIFVEGGTFVMDGGSHKGEQAVSDFNIGKYEVTQGQWKALMGNNPSAFPKGDNYPVENVSWNDAQEFIRRLNTASGKQFRLPTEAEWEYAARGGAKSKDYRHSGSNNLGKVAWYRYNSNGATHRVGTKGPNELNIYDMSGNVYEMCNDYYIDDTQTTPSKETYRVIRGGSWSGYEHTCYVSFGSRRNPNNGEDDKGFRLVLPNNSIYGDIGVDVANDTVVVDSRAEKEDAPVPMKQVLEVTKIELANADGDGNIIDDFGSKLSVERLRYLYPKITFKNKLKSGKDCNFLIYIGDNNNNTLGRYDDTKYISTSDTECILAGYGSQDGGWVSAIGNIIIQIFSLDDGSSLISEKFFIYK